MSIPSNFIYFEAGFSPQRTKMACKPVHPLRVIAFLLLAFWAVPGTTWSQGSIEVDGTVRDKDSNRKLSGVTVQVLRAGSNYDEVTTLGNGKYALSLDHGADYELIFTFDDLSPRKVELNTSSIPEDYRERPFYLTVEMSMFEVPPGFDQGLLDEPIGKVRFDAAKEQLAWDLDYTARMQARIENALSDALSSGEGEENASNAEYEEHMRKAEVEFGRERWEQSINWLERALSVIPGDSRAEAMMEDAMERLENAEQEAEARRDYEAKMREGKMAMRKASWNEAAVAFRAANSLLPNETEPLELLAEVEAELQSGAGADADYDEAMAEGQTALDGGNLDLAETAFERASSLKPGERLPKEKLAEIRQQRKSAEREADAMSKRMEEYQELIAGADKAFDDQDFVRAKSLYEEASTVMPDEIYPRTRAQEAASRIVALGGDEEEEEASSATSDSDRGDREYEDRVRLGDEAFDKEEWDAAAAAYNSALELRPDERYPKNRLKRIESMRGDGAEVTGDLEVDRRAKQAENEAAAAAAAAAASAMSEEQARLLEEERRAAKLEEERRASASSERKDSELERSRNYVLALQSAGDDDAEAYYRDALESEIKARGQAVYARRDRQDELEEVWVSNSDTRRQSSYRELTAEAERQAVEDYESSTYRNGRIADFEAVTTERKANNKDWEARGDANRRDRLISLTQKSESNARALFDRTKRYAVFVDSLDRMLEAYEDFNRDLRKSSLDTRIMRFEEIQRKTVRHARVGAGEESRRLDRWNDVQAQSRETAQSQRIASNEAELRSAAALRKVQTKETGEAPTSADYREVPAMEGIRQGVEERSYEEGNALIIERTVRVDNEVNIYRKTVAKHGVYYFKNNRSITREIWVLETFEISD